MPFVYLSNPNRLGAAAGGVVQRGVDGCLGWRGAMDGRRDVFSEDLFKMLRKFIKRILRFYMILCF